MCRIDKKYEVFTSFKQMQVDEEHEDKYCFNLIFPQKLKLKLFFNI